MTSRINFNQRNFRRLTPLSRQALLNGYTWKDAGNGGKRLGENDGIRKYSDDSFDEHDGRASLTNIVGVDIFFFFFYENLSKCGQNFVVIN